MIVLSQRQFRDITSQLTAAASGGASAFMADQAQALDAGGPQVNALSPSSTSFWHSVQVGVTTGLVVWVITRVIEKAFKLE